MSMNRTLSLVVASVVLALQCPGLAGPYYKVTDIGSGDITPLAINNHNEVVGQVIDVAPNVRHAFYWDPASGLSSIGGYSASDINDAGQIAGNSSLYQAAVWENGSWLTLEDRQNAEGINDYGQVTGLISAQPWIPGPYAPYRDDDIYTPGFITLENPIPDRAGSGFDINNAGQVVAISGGLGVFYDQDGAYTVLDSADSTHPYAINDAGQIAGYARDTVTNVAFPIFWSSPSASMVPMGNLGTGDSWARGLNNLGYAVGRSSGRAFLWSLDSGIVDLNDLIDPALSITLTEARDINDFGAIIAQGIDATGLEHAYLLTPEPGMLILFLAGSLSLRRNRKSGTRQ